jgi:hypothetical protein
MTLDTPFTLTHERVDDLPLLYGLITQLQIPQAVATHLGTHGLQQGLENGQLVAVWLVYILSEGAHTKSTVAAWVAQHQQTLEALLGTAIRPTDFTDDRLGNLLRRFRDDAAWAAMEAALWQHAAVIYAVPERVRLDSTTASGFHTIEPAGVMPEPTSKLLPTALMLPANGAIVVLP